MPNTNALVDAGPLIALFDSDEKNHSRMIAFFKGFQGSLWSTWPVLTEALHILGFNFEIQNDFLNWIERGGVNIFDLFNEDLKTIREYMGKYRDLPMDFADASLVVAAKKMGIREIITFDKDFTVYRLPHKKTFRNFLTNPSFPW